MKSDIQTRASGHRMIDGYAYCFVRSGQANVFLRFSGHCSGRPVRQSGKLKHGTDTLDEFTRNVHKKRAWFQFGLMAMEKRTAMLKSNWRKHHEIL